MQFEDRSEGEYRIYAGSLELQTDQGFLGAVIVNRRLPGIRQPVEVFRDTAISGGHRWPTSEQALQHALLLGSSAVAAEARRASAEIMRGL